MTASAKGWGPRAARWRLKTPPGTSALGQAEVGHRVRNNRMRAR